VLELQAQVAYRSGALDVADALLVESLAVFRAHGVKWGVAGALATLADVACMRGDDVRATALYRESLAFYRMSHSRLGTIGTLEGLARVAHRQGRLEEAIRLWAVTQAQREALGTPLWPVGRLAYERDLATLRAALGQEAFAAEWAAGRALTLDEAIEQALGESR
jgi:hypothetical protein